jgi:putative addiction module CopG family antidote
MRIRNNIIMNVPIPPEFEAFARKQVAAGRYGSEAEVVAEALKQYLADREALLALIDPAIEQLDRGEGRPFDAADTKRRGRERRQRASACPD